MIRFIKHTATKDYRVGGRYIIRKGDPILKILFDPLECHISRTKQQHLDIWGSKLKELTKTLKE